MNPQSWELVKATFAAASKMAPDRAEAFVRETCRDDQLACQETLAMLRTTLWAGHSADTLHQHELVPGTLVSERFKVEHMIAQGGMGKVYRALDLKLKRIVALKAVRANGRLTRELRERLRQEADLISKLNHPSICVLYDASEHEGVDYLVMEFLEGETLEQRMARKPLALSESIRVALDLLSAMDYAHRQGIIHRDLKPGNVMLTKGGTKLLDFGIAKLRNYNDTSEAFTTGTPIYMAPEQLPRGVSDVRTDIYSFGLMLQQMLTNSPVNTAKTILNAAMISRSIKQIVSKCLAEDPADRWQDAGDLRCALEMASEEPLGLALQQKKANSLKRLAAFMTLVAVASISWAILSARRPPDARLEYQILPPPDTEFLPIEQAGPPVVSPDGNVIVFVARDKTSQRLWLRRADSVSAVAIEGTDGAIHPFWSPDSRTIGFFANKKLQTIELGSTRPKVLCDAEEGRSGTWSRDGVIAFSPSYTAPLFRVSATGGMPVPITTMDSGGRENSHRWPSFLPDGQHVLFVIRSNIRERNGLYSVSILGGQPKRIGQVDSSAVYSGPSDGRLGHLFYMRNSAVVAQPFLPGSQEFSGEPVTVAQLGYGLESSTRAPLSVSETGVLVYGGGENSKSQLRWYDMNGNSLAVQPEIYDWRTRFLRLSPSNDTIVMERIDFRFGSGSLWLKRDKAPVFFGMDPLSIFAPVWSPNGLNIAFAVDKGTTFELMMAPIDGGHSRRLVSSAAMVVPTDWTSDGSLLYEIEHGDGGWELRTTSVNELDRKVVPLNLQVSERYGRVSPDGHWLAYTSLRTGTEEVWIRSFPPSDPAFQVSVSGGTQPVWSRSSNDLYFIDHDRRLVRSRLHLSARRAEPPRILFPLPKAIQPGRTSGWEYDITRNEDRVILTLPDSVHESKPITVVRNWRSQ